MDEGQGARGGQGWANYIPFLQRMYQTLTAPLAITVPLVLALSLGQPR